MDNVQLATKIKQLCKNKNITVKSLLAACNINSIFVYELEKRGKIPSIEKIELIADYLGVSIDYLVGRTDDSQEAATMQTYKDDVMTKEEAEIVGVYRLLNVRDRAKLMSLIFELEDSLQKTQ